MGTTITPSELTLREIREHFSSIEGPPPESVISLLQSDPRAGVRRLGGAFRKRRRSIEAEETRVREMQARERELWGRGISYVAGVDEVGVGPFAGPVVAGAVVFPPGCFLRGVRDSKQLSPDRRLSLDAEIRRHAVAVGIGEVGVDEIDLINILRASMKAMRLAIIDLGMKVQHLLVDGRGVTDAGVPQDAVVDGDKIVFSIAAASVVAKVYRDDLMVRYDARYPHYGFARNKGYGTAEHIRALREHGPCEIHRKSFAGISGSNLYS